VELRPRLIDVAVPADPRGAVLVLHGGAARRERMRVSPAQLSVLRMIPIARRIARTAQGRLAVLRLLNSHRGWDTHHTPVDDTRCALRDVLAHFGAGLPTCLVGHSLGGRAAILAAAQPQVVAAVALAPWVYPSDVPRGGGLRGKRLLFVHGASDRVASPQRSAVLAKNLAEVAGAQVTFVGVRGGRHAMLKHHELFSGLAAGFAASAVLGEEVATRARAVLDARGRAAFEAIAAGEAFVSV
jgi:dienelactone hydrolase